VPDVLLAFLGAQRQDLGADGDALLERLQPGVVQDLVEFRRGGKNDLDQLVRRGLEIGQLYCKWQSMTLPKKKDFDCFIPPE
jgi:hypothetical protein